MVDSSHLVALNRCEEEHARDAGDSGRKEQNRILSRIGVIVCRGFSRVHNDSDVCDSPVPPAGCAGTRDRSSCSSCWPVAGGLVRRGSIFEEMFHPYDSPSFETAAEAPIDSDDKVLAVKVGTEARAYPIRTMGYHHIVNDTLDGVPIAVTYCTLCHTGLVWSRIVEGKVLHFRLAGINNGNALLRDEQTNSIWQQSTGEAIFGPLKGQQLKLVHSDELSFALWKSEQPNGQVLKSDPLYAAEYDPKDWEKHVARTPTVVNTTKSGIGPHELMLGVIVVGQSKAYPIETILRTKLIQDRVGGIPLLVLVGPDQASIRVFEGNLENEPLTFARGAADQGMSDVETGSIWNFQGCAVNGKLAGRCLVEIDSHKDYWFDWMNHHPGSAVFRG